MIASENTIGNPKIVKVFRYSWSSSWISSSILSFRHLLVFGNCIQLVTIRLSGRKCIEILIELHEHALHQWSILVRIKLCHNMWRIPGVWRKAWSFFFQDIEWLTNQVHINIFTTYIVNRFIQFMNWWVEQISHNCISSHFP